MGGDTFEGVEKLTNEEFLVMVPELISQLEELSLRVETYMPLPQKNMHGDIDLILLLREGVEMIDIIKTLKIERFLINNNGTMNSVYKNKQVDFCIVSSHEEFQTTAFYKSYSGFGAYLGSFLSDFGLKLSTQGLFAIEHEGHLHYELQLSTDIRKILCFYGMQYQNYHQGFNSRKQLFEFMRTCKFLNEMQYAEINVNSLARRVSRSIGKLSKQFISYLREQKLKEKQIPCLKSMKDEALEFFGKKQEFEEGVHHLLLAFKRKQLLNKKFNAKHILDQLNVKIKEVDLLKKTFLESFLNEEEYYDFIEQNCIDEILDKFIEKCQVSRKEGKQIEQEDIKTKQKYKTFKKEKKMKNTVEKNVQGGKNPKKEEKS